MDTYPYPFYGGLYPNWWGPPYTIIFDNPLMVGDTWKFKFPRDPSYAQQAGSGAYTAVAIFAMGTYKLTSEAEDDPLSNYFKWAIPCEETEKLAPGVYSITVQIHTPSGERFTVQNARTNVAPDLATSTNVCTCDVLREQLDACNRAITKLLSKEVQSFTYSGKTYTLWDIAKLYKIRDQLSARLQREEAMMTGNMREDLIIPLFVRL